MQRIRMDLENLAVETFQPEGAVDGGFTAGAEDPAFMIAGGYCCTGCVSGCGINPTAGGCASGGTDPLLR